MGRKGKLLLWLKANYSLFIVFNLSFVRDYMEEQRLTYHYRLFTVIEKGFSCRYKSSDFEQCMYKHHILDSENFK